MAGAMIIEKILNNNVIISRDEKFREVIAMGKGIGYQRRKGDVILDETVDKLFILKDPDNSRMLQKLMLEIPMEYIQAAHEIIDLAKDRLNQQLNESIYIALSDHIHSAISRLGDGEAIRNLLLWDIKHFYKEEFQVGREALKILEKRFCITIPEDEAGFIALHIVNAELNTDIKMIYDITRMIQEITNIVRYHFRIQFDEDSVYYYRFLTHLKFFAKRMESGLYEPEEKMDDLYLVVKAKYPAAFECAEKIGNYIRSQFRTELSEEEKVYLTIHIERIVADSRHAAKET